MNIKRGWLSEEIKEINGEKVTRSFFHNRIKRVGDKKIYTWWGNIKSIGGRAIEAFPELAHALTIDMKEQQERTARAIVCSNQDQQRRHHRRFK
jgi:hypothetical protein